MASKKNHADEFASEEDATTVELVVQGLNDSKLTGASPNKNEAAGNAGGPATNAASENLESDLESRNKTIDRLQFDIEKLHAKWLGLEAEIKAREDQTVQLNQQLSDQKIAIDRQQKRVESRDDKVKSLKLEIRRRDEEHQTLLTDFGDFEQVLNEAEKSLAEAAVERTAAAEVLQNLNHSEEITKELQVQTVQLYRELDELNSVVTKKDDAIITHEEKNRSLESRIEQATDENQTIRAALDDLQAELSGAQKRIAEATVERAEAAEVLLKLNNAEEVLETLQIQNARQDEDLAEQKGVIARKEEMIERRDEKVRILESQVGQANARFESLENEFGEFQKSMVEVEKTATQALADRADAGDLRIKLKNLNEYADSVRHQYQDRIESFERMERDHVSLENSLSAAALETEELVSTLRAAEQRTGELRSKISSQDHEHEQATQALQLEHDQRKDSLTEMENLNNRLSSDLIESRGSNDYLKQTMTEAEEKANKRIDRLRDDVESLTRNAERYEHKLATKSEAIAALLAELATKSAQLESIEKIEGVIQDIDDRMSERITEDKNVGHEVDSQRPQKQKPSSSDKVTRVLVGAVDGQVLRFPLFKNRLEIGRAEDNDIQVTADYVSRQHAIIQTDDETTRITDWDSKNGIYVNEERVDERILNHGDTVTIGDAQFRYEERRKR